MNLCFFAAFWVSVLGVSLGLWHSSFVASPRFFGYLQVASGMMALTVAATSLLRFHTDRDRFSLFLGLAFLLSGLAIVLTIPVFFDKLQGIAPDSLQKAPWSWWLTRSLFAFLLMAAGTVGRRASKAAHPIREIALALMISGGIAVLATTGLQHLPASWVIQSSGAVKRPLNLVLAIAFLGPAFEFGRRFNKTGSPCDAGIFLAATLNVGCHIAAGQSVELMDAAFFVAQGLKTLGYAAAVGGMLVESARLYGEVRSLAVKDSLTGLANYRLLTEVIEGEIHRSGRTGRQFAILLLDLDGLKNINDRYGHVTGSQALCRVADILRSVCRGTDTAARYGGDEFVLVLPETAEESVHPVIARIRARLRNDSSLPHLSVSIGLAVYPVHAMTITTLLEAADKSLYAMKSDHSLHLVPSRI